MAELPVGTITFFLTDIEGSTKLWEQYPEMMKVALARHDAILTACIEQHEGLVIRSRGEGDSFFAVFARASDAVAAGCAIQQALITEPWPEQIRISVRVALHTGEAELREGDYYGSVINRCARLRAIAHGGQALVSQTTYDLVRDVLPAGAALKDLGEHRLRDFSRPERVFQLLHPELSGKFPPLKSLDNLPNNLPRHLTSFIGREKEIVQIKNLLATTYLLTLTGVGGCGKTRLALQVAADMVEQFPEGVWLVELAALSDPALISQAVASTWGLREEVSHRASVPGGLTADFSGDRLLLSKLIDYLQPKRLLLILDNCEHLLSACAQLADALLRACPKLCILASSREALGIAGERSYRVPSLSLPDPQHLLTIESLTQYEAVRLFIERAAAALPSFQVTNSNAPAVAQICYRLDGIPLAIELAAARVNVLIVEQIAERLDDRFRLLTGGSRIALPRQQTLRAAIDWSFDLLSEGERVLLRRLSIFAGGWTLEAAESICGGEGITEPEVLELLMHLVQKSLVLFEGQGQEAWYKQLETVRQYAREKLLESGEAGVVRARHLDWYIKLAEQAEVQLQGPEQVIWLNRLKREYDNFRTALAWCKAEENGAETGLRLAGALWRSWEIHGHFSEGRKWLEDALAQGSSASKQVRAKALYGAGVLVGYHWAYRQAKVLFEESLALYREFGDKQGIARALGGLGGAIDGMDGKKELIIGLFEESLALCREIGDKKGIAMALESLATYMREKEYDNDYERAKTLYQESLALYRELGEKRGIAQLVNSLGWLTFYHYADFFPPDLEPAKALYEESLILFRELGDTGGIADSLTGLGWVAIHQSDYERATSLFTENLTLGRELGYTWLATVSLRGLGIVAQYQGNYQQAEALYQEQLAIVKKSENSTWTVTALGDLGSVALCQKKYEQAEALFREGLALNQKLGLDETVAAMILDCLGSVKRYQGNYQEATVIFEKNLALYRRKGIKWGIFSALCYLEVLARYQGDYERAEKLLKEALSQIREQKLSVVPHLVLPHLEVLAGVACAQRQHEHAAQFFGAADAVRQAIGRPLPPCDRTDYDRDVEVARTALSAEGFAAEWAKGRAMTLEQAVEYALEKLSQA